MASEIGVQLPLWQSHKRVHGDAIVEIRPVGTQGDTCWVLACGTIIGVETVKEVTKRSSPIVGDYFVLYEDGYESWSPKKAWEDGYTRIG